MGATVVTNDPMVADAYAASGKVVRLVQRPARIRHVEWREPAARRHRTTLGPALTELAARPGEWGVIAKLHTDGQARSARRAVIDIGGFDSAIRRTSDGYELFAVATIPPFEAVL